MFTKIDLCSMALLKLGEKPIQSLREDSATAQLARTLFDSVVNTLLSVFPWCFATQLISINKNSDGDCLIPSNVLRIIKCDGKIVGNKIITPAEKIDLVAVVQVNPEDFPDYFASLVATKLALEFCIPLTGDTNVFKMLFSLYEAEYQTAKFIDSTISNQTNIDNFSLINSRF